VAKFSASDLTRKLREAQRKAEQQIKQQVDQVNRENKRRVDEYNRKANAHNQKVISNHNAAIQQHNRGAVAHNQQVITNLNNRLRAASAGVGYTESERVLADRIHQSVSTLDAREYDSFLSYARIDGSQVANELRSQLEELGVSVWFDEVSIVPGRSQSLQMDAGLRKARTGIALLTPAYLTGRFWTERELGVLLSKSTLIPVLHNVTFNDVRSYSGILPDLAGFTTEHDSVAVIAEKIAAALLFEN